MSPHQRLLRSFPRGWRARYGGELSDLIEDMEEDGRDLGLGDQLDLAFAGLSERGVRLWARTARAPAAVALRVLAGGAAVVVALGTGLVFGGVLNASSAEAIYGTGGSAFVAAFPKSPETLSGARDGYLTFKPEQLGAEVVWSAGPASVVTARLEGTVAEGLSSLRSLAATRGAPERADGLHRRGQLAWTTVVWHVRKPGGLVPPWSVGLLELRGRDFFYATSSGDTLAQAAVFVKSFRLPNQS
jgi:hypothetical protein